MGRPPLAEGKVREIVFTLRLSAEERDSLVSAAGVVPVTQWARQILLAQARASKQ